MCEKCKTENRASDSDSDLRLVVARLAKKQEELADVLQRFMNGMAEQAARRARQPPRRTAPRLSGRFLA